MATEWNIIGDVHGDYDALMRLVKIMPDVGFMSVGDMIDRGPKSLETMQFFMRPGNKAILGNHEHLMLQSLEKRSCYDKGVWFETGNGGFKTVMSMHLIKFDILLMDAMCGNNVETSLEELEDIFKKSIKDFPEGLLTWLQDLPLAYENESLFVTHATYEPGYYDPKIGLSEKRLSERFVEKMIWNIGPSKRVSDRFHVHGHIRVERPEWHRDEEGVYGINIDTGRGNILTGIHWPSMEIYSVQKGV